MVEYFIVPFVLIGDLVPTLTRLRGCRDGGHFKSRHMQIFKSPFGCEASTPLPVEKPLRRKEAELQLRLECCPTWQFIPKNFNLLTSD